MAGILHRDIKPSNLLLTRTGRCKVADFGLALPLIQGDDFRLSSGLVGTPHFLAPEVLQMRPASPASDVYSLTATLYAVLTGRPPFPSDDPKELHRVVVGTPAPDIREIVPHASPALVELIEQGLAKKPYQRLSADEMAGVLRTEVASLSDAVAPSPVAGISRIPAPSGVPSPSSIPSPSSVPAPSKVPAASKTPGNKSAVIYWRGHPVQS
jgi:serine/threonine-protein kinase